VIGDHPAMASNVNWLQDGIRQLASGSQALATGVHTLVDSNIETLGGMSQIATQLQNSARASTRSDASSGFFLPWPDPNRLISLICPRRFEPWLCGLRDRIGRRPERFELCGADVTEVAVPVFLLGSRPESR
jgi:X-X-X-Leu-X-X-Gly heptad repeat protein